MAGGETTTCVAYSVRASDAVDQAKSDMSLSPCRRQLTVAAAETR